MLNDLSQLFDSVNDLDSFLLSGKKNGSEEETTYLTAAYAYFAAACSVKAADIAAAMNLEAIRGETGAFDSRLHEIARPYQGQIDSAANIRALIAGSRAVTWEGRYAFGYDEHPRVQDAICIRATPQTHGGVRDFLYWFGHCLEEENLLFEQVEYAACGLVTALADLAHISERRAFRLNDTRLSYGLPMNLVPDRAGINHGFPVVQSNQAAFVADLKLLTLPTAAIKTDNECHARHAVDKILKALPLLQKTLAIEVLMCAQAMDIVHEKIPEYPFGQGTTAAWKKIRETIPLLTQNRFVSPYMCEAERLIRDKELLKAVEKLTGLLR